MPYVEQVVNLLPGQVTNLPHDISIPIIIGPGRAELPEGRKAGGIGLGTYPLHVGEWSAILKPMSDYRFTDYFENEVLRKRPYLQKHWCIAVIENPIKVELQENNRYRFWGEIEELEGRVLRVVTLADRQTIHNAFPDRGFKP